MVEKVGVCLSCNKVIYCIDGFLDGIVKESKIYCFACAETSISQ